ncbi:hypothetical protein [Paraburkholderia sp. BL6665CI2N2]|uniref:hypothetical protein n=1 Tax=Paraburkholderia sp. BL6665CI2N2 TaxID=1938806 RepID=UPI00106691C7|nr:hypothetical protein [Paraburkholderia sp. BL6665CI2N2]
MSDANLFGRVEELREAMLRLERGCDATAMDLRSRIAAQERAVPELGKFAAGIQSRHYVSARELVVAVVARSMTADRLEVLLLRLECSYVKAKVRANRSRSNVRFAPFWAEFDAIVRRHVCSTADEAHKRAATGTPQPHPKLSVAQKRYRRLMNGTC